MALFFRPLTNEGEDGQLVDGGDGSASPTETDPADLRFDAFLCYASKPDARLAQQTEAYLETIHTVPRPEDGPDLRALRICRDGSDFDVGTRVEPIAGLTPVQSTFARHLDQSSSLIVMCSGGAAQSPHVNWEIEWFSTKHPERPMFVVVTEGEPGEAPGLVFPPALRARGGHEPIWIDFRGASRKRRRSATRVRDYDEARLQLAAAVYGGSIRAADISPGWYRQQALEKRRRLKISVFVGILIPGLVVVVVVLGVRADENRRRAEKEATLANAGRLATEANMLANERPNESGLRALAAHRLLSDSGLEELTVEQAVFAATERLGGFVLQEMGERIRHYDSGRDILITVDAAGGLVGRQFGPDGPTKLYTTSLKSPARTLKVTKDGCAHVVTAKGLVFSGPLKTAPTQRLDLMGDVHLAAAPDSCNGAIHVVMTSGDWRRVPRSGASISIRNVGLDAQVLKIGAHGRVGLVAPSVQGEERLWIAHEAGAGTLVVEALQSQGVVETPSPEIHILDGHFVVRASVEMRGQSRQGVMSRRFVVRVWDTRAPEKSRVLLDVIIGGAAPWAERALFTWDGMKTTLWQPEELMDASAQGTELGVQPLKPIHLGARYAAALHSAPDRFRLLDLTQKAPAKQTHIVDVSGDVLGIHDPPGAQPWILTRRPTSSGSDTTEAISLPLGPSSVTRRLAGHDKEISFHTVKGASGWLMTIGEDGDVRWWNLGQPLRSRPFPQFSTASSTTGPSSIDEIRRVGRNIWVRGGAFFNTRDPLWSIDEMGTTRRVGGSRSVEDFLFARDESWLAVGSDNDITLFSADAGRWTEKGRVPKPVGNVRGMQRIPGGIVVSHGPRISLWSEEDFAARKEPSETLDRGGELARGSIMGTDKGEVCVLSWKPNRSLDCRTLARHATAVSKIALSPDGRRGVSIDRDRELRAWGKNLEQVVVGTVESKMMVGSLAISNEGQVAVGLTTGVVLLFDPARSDLPRPLVAGAVSGSAKVAWSPLEEVLYSSTWDGRVVRWSIGNKATSAPLTMARVASPIVALLVEAEHVWAASADGRVHRWPTGLDAWAAVLAEQVSPGPVPELKPGIRSSVDR